MTFRFFGTNTSFFSVFPFCRIKSFEVVWANHICNFSFVNWPRTIIHQTYINLFKIICNVFNAVGYCLNENWRLWCWHSSWANKDVVEARSNHVRIRQHLKTFLFCRQFKFYSFVPHGHWGNKNRTFVLMPEASTPKSQFENKEEWGIAWII